MFKDASEQMKDQALRDMIAKGEGIEKVAQTASEVTRTQIREGSFANKILPPEKIGNERLTKTMTEDLIVIDDLEPDSPGAKYVPFETVPEGEIITGSRYITPLARIVTPKFTKDIDLLRTYDYPIRKMLTDNSIKDGMATHDRKFIQTVNSIVSNADHEGAENRVTGKVQWRDFDTLNRESFVEATKMLPAGNKNDKFVARNYVMLAHENTLRDVLKFRRNEIGGDQAQDNWKNGLTDTTILGIKAISTIKRSLVPEGYVYFFAEPSFLGHNYTLTDWTMYLKKEAFFIEWFSYWLGGFSFGNVAAMAVARFGREYTNRNGQWDDPSDSSPAAKG